MNTFKKIFPLWLLLAGIVISCSQSEEQSVIDEVAPPVAVTLKFPENNTECNEGEIISETETDVLFRWQDATNANDYMLQIINLNSGISKVIKTPSNEFLLRISRGTPYSWSVKSKVSGSNESAESEIWKFYNAGLAVESHPPFPADAVSPQMGSTIDPGNVTLRWETTDINNDISAYKVLLDTANPPLKEVANSSVNNLNITVHSGQVYYWKVITIDEAGNTSNSQIFQFKVN